MAENQEITAAKERVNALREQVRQEQQDRQAAATGSANDARLSALDAEERHLEQQLAEIRATPMPGADPNAPVGIAPGQVDAVRLAASSVSSDTTEGTIETVDAEGNLVRTPLSEVPDLPEAEQLPAPDDGGGMREPDAPPPPGVPDDATMTSRAPRR